MTEFSNALLEIRKLEGQAARAAPGTLHVAIVADGNEDWRRRRDLPPTMGRYHGARAVRGVITAAAAEGVTHLTLIGFSAESAQPAEAELPYLLSLLHGCLARDGAETTEAAIRLSVIGDRAPLPADIAGLIDELERLTRGNSGLHLTIALNHRSRSELVAAARRLAVLVEAGTMEPEDIDQATFGAQLTTAGLPDPDLMIRTGGRQQLSNFLLWQLAYAELVFVEKSWPDFTGADLKEALADFRRRQRRFGAIPSDGRPGAVNHL